MGRALKPPAGMLCVCLAGLMIAGRPLSAQQQSDTQKPDAQQPSASIPSPPATLYGDNGFSITIDYWKPTGHPYMGDGHLNTSGTSTALDFAGNALGSEGAAFGIPIGKLNALRVSYFRLQGVGNPTAPTDLAIDSISYNAGDYMAVHYRLQNIKIGLDYLSWPFPVKDSKFRLMTLWEVQYTTIYSSFDAPLRHGETDASGNPIQTWGYGTNWFIYPSLGLGAIYHVSHRLRFEARASGFAFPHRSTIWDAEATLNYRFGKMEIQGGAKAFHFKTSPAQVSFVQATFPGAFVGLRWYLESSKY